MHTAVVTGPWQLRHNEPSEAGAVLHAVDLDPEQSFSSLVLDLRRHGLNNIDPVHAPLAIVRTDGEAIEFEAMVLRQDEHQVHFIRPGDLGGCSTDVLDRTLGALFETWHLRLNNFECCVFPAPQLSTAVHGELQAQHISSVAQSVLDAISAGEWRGFHLQPGSELQRLQGEVTALVSIDGTTIVGIKPGARRKKSGFDETAWHIEQFRKEGDGWFRRKVVEPKSTDLRPFDQSPANVGALQWPEAGPWRRLCTVQENLFRIGVESARSPALIEVDIAHRVCLDPSALNGSGFDLPLRSIILRPVAGRAPLQPEAAADDVDALAGYVARLEGARLGALRKSDMPAGLSASAGATAAVSRAAASS